MLHDYSGKKIRHDGRDIAEYTPKYGMRERYWSWRCLVCGSEPDGHYGAAGDGVKTDATKHYVEFHKSKGDSMTPQFSIGQTVQLSDAGRENESYKDIAEPLTITAIYDHIGRDETGHPGYDPNIGQPLYDFAGCNFSLYEYEIEETEA
jgi:hypothetical protein